MLAVLSFSLAVLVSAPDQEGLKIGQDAPYFVLRTMNAKITKVDRFVLRNLVGDRATTKKSAVVLSFAASYCEPCRKELAELSTLKAKLDAANIELAVVVIDTEKEGIEMMRKLTVDELKLPYPVLSDRFGVLARRYSAKTLPTTVVIDSLGKVRWKSTGFRKDTLQKLQAQLLKMKPQ